MGLWCPWVPLGAARGVSPVASTVDPPTPLPSEMNQRGHLLLL